ncbi:NAD-dependent malic enzyme [Salsipaludibacter albus]|uniref:NAD-dependent malic enzyme n=1 Tax=Salsipaludibacter albus TaxID=2849650 RepID=UPI001EE4751F|nr:NAD-dependent malic enzyme [Salsipaludibacter albus]MBY5162492.1 NAD-dependent malic enzyme [Salsipaludibacter albus]
MRLYLDPEDQRAIGRVTTVVGDHGASVTAVDFVSTRDQRVTVDVTANARDSDHSSRLAEAVEELEGVHVHRVSDRTFLSHLRGKLAVRSRVPLKTRDDLSMAYTPGVARVCLALVDKPQDARSLTIKGNTVAIVTDGTAVLGLGDIGPVASLPVMEGKAVLFKQFADVDAWPVALDTTDTEEIIAIVKAMAPVYGGINLEDIAAPRCFEIEERLRDELDIPVFHDDQHGTAIVVLAALTNALRLVGKDIGDITATMVGAGAAGVAIAKLLVAQGIGDVRVVDRHGIIERDSDQPDSGKQWIAETTNVGRVTGSVVDSLEGADVFIGVSGPSLFDAGELSRMADDAIVFALANPEPEVDPILARDHAAVVATGRSDYPNQINNVLAFPGVFRGALDARARAITEEMKVAAALAIADTVHADELHPFHIIPSVFNTDVVPAVAAAIRDVVERGEDAAPAPSFDLEEADDLV